MERLKNLKTLEVRNTNLERLPIGISKLSKLIHLYMYRANDQNFESFSVPSSMQAPARIWNIGSLQTLACVQVEEELIKHIGNLTELKRLEIIKFRAVDGPKLCTSIQKMKSLLRLGVMATNPGEELQLVALCSPLIFLQKLTLIGQLNSLPH